MKVALMGVLGVAAIMSDDHFKGKRIVVDIVLGAMVYEYLERQGPGLPKNDWG
jgi:hypothetical protein